MYVHGACVSISLFKFLIIIVHLYAGSQQPLEQSWTNEATESANDRVG